MRRREELLHNVTQVHISYFHCQCKFIYKETVSRVISNTPMDDKFHIVNGQKASTESSITWTRPAKKKKKTQEATNVLNLLTNNKYLQLKPPSYYAIE